MSITTRGFGGSGPSTMGWGVILNPIPKAVTTFSDKTALFFRDLTSVTFSDKTAIEFNNKSST